MLTTKQRAFIEAYFSNGLDAASAALSAGYPSEEYGTQNLLDPIIQAEIERRFKESDVSESELEQLLAKYKDKSPRKRFRIRTIEKKRPRAADIKAQSTNDPKSESN